MEECPAHTPLKLSCIAMHDLGFMTSPHFQGGAECSQRVFVTAFQSERASDAAAAAPVRCDSADSQLAAALAASAAGTSDLH